MILILGFSGTGGILLVGPGGEEQAGVLGVADGGLGVEAEHCCQVQRVGPVGEGFLELPVDAEPFQGGGLAAEFGLGEVDRADWPGAHRRVLVDEQVRVGGVWPAGAPVAEPVEQDLVGEFVDRADPSGDGEPAVAHVDVVELDGADGAGAGGVDRGEHEHQPGCRVAAAPAAWSTSSWPRGWAMP
jgi:hypothetical protein